MPPAPRQLQSALLLLPPAPSPASYAALKAAYHSPLFSVLRALARSPRRAQEPAVLHIALPCPHLYGHLNAPRRPLYAATQSLVADMYKLICIIAAQEAIDPEDAEGVDARIVLLAYPRHGQLMQPAEDASPEQEVQGPVVDLHTLARSPGSWDTIYSVESEEGEALLKNFLAQSPSERTVSRVRGGIVKVETASISVAPAVHASTDHFSVAVGGTFDHLHIGHKLLLTMFAFVLSRRPPSIDDQTPSNLTIGITGDALLKNKKHADYLESWQLRQQAVHDFLSSIVYFGAPNDARILVEERTDPEPNGHAVHVTYPSNLVVKYVEIWDPFGPTITDADISALVISLETRSGGKAVNDKRAEKGWAPLEVFEVAVLDASEEESIDETFQSKLSSTEIRRLRSERARPKPSA
ncbi:pantetheine-phosphate adenylyltransferase family protein-like protein [Massariosphaeria phaeospora]|uniref:Pantetheine-phosphate adenylyltransferase family protein-like protein n=1 Tax=Massariosphaeria phaeospora TaxID=100035 RepID=A0A7C8M9A2_9PLEO|nr:pantetheine-phosphate adenylyltransferase family protein-like protein [Massariosphaeria phaeospora]